MRTVHAQLLDGNRVTVDASECATVAQLKVLVSRGIALLQATATLVSAVLFASSMLGGKAYSAKHIVESHQ
jgi:hypothetical protein